MERSPLFLTRRIRLRWAAIMLALRCPNIFDYPFLTARTMWGCYDRVVMPVQVLDMKGVPHNRRERITAAVEAGGKHCRDSTTLGCVFNTQDNQAQHGITRLMCLWTDDA